MKWTPRSEEMNIAVKLMKMPNEWHARKKVMEVLRALKIMKTVFGAPERTKGAENEDGVWGTGEEHQQERMMSS
jgi:hypothetical protein